MGLKVNRRHKMAQLTGGIHPHNLCYTAHYNFEVDPLSLMQTAGISDTFHEKGGYTPHFFSFVACSFVAQAVNINLMKKKAGVSVYFHSFRQNDLYPSSLFKESPQTVPFPVGPISEPYILAHLQVQNLYLISTVQLSSLEKFTGLSKGKQKVEENTFHTSDGQFYFL